MAKEEQLHLAVLELAGEAGGEWEGAGPDEDRGGIPKRTPKITIMVMIMILKMRMAKMGKSES